MNDAAAGPLVEAKGVVKSYRLARRTIEVLRGVDLAVNAGEFIAVVGPSGAGKSTLLHILGTLEAPSAGEVLLGGRNVAAMSEQDRALLRRRDIGFVFQFHHLLPAFSALENVMMPARILGKGAAEAAGLARDLLAGLGLGDRLENKPAELSGGEQQRVAVARALVNRPHLILADEPTGNLDRPTGRLLEDDLVRFARERGAAVVVVTHNEEWAGRAGRVLRLIDGRIADGASSV